MRRAVRKQNFDSKVDSPIRTTAMKEFPSLSARQVQLVQFMLSCCLNEKPANHLGSGLMYEYAGLFAADRVDVAVVQPCRLI